MVTTPVGRSRPPLFGADLWTAVMDAAAWRCQCSGECGNHHDRDRRSGHRTHSCRCGHEHTTARPLHAIPTTHLSNVAAMRLPPEQLVAVCIDCHTRITRRRRRDHEQANPPPVSEPLF